MRRIILAALVAATVVAIPATASADTTCKHVKRSGVEAGIYVWGKTSCGLGMNAARAILRRGYSPRVLYVASPVTGRRYRLVRENLDNDFTSYYSAVYRGANDIHVQLQIYY